MSSTTLESAAHAQRGWVLSPLVGNERHFFFDGSSACGLHFVPSLCAEDYEGGDDRAANCWLCEEMLERMKGVAVMDEAIALLIKEFLEENWSGFVAHLRRHGEEFPEGTAEEIIATLHDLINGKG